MNRIDIFVYDDFFKIIIDSLNFCKKNKGLKLFGYVIMPNHLHLIIKSLKKIVGSSYETQTNESKSADGSSYETQTNESKLADGSSYETQTNESKSADGSSLKLEPSSFEARTNELGNAEDIIRDFKHFTANQIIKKLKEYKKAYILNLLHLVGSQKSRQNYQVWEHKNYPEIIEKQDFFLQKLSYIHNNPVKRGFVEKPEHWLYSSARNYMLDDNSVIEIDRIS